MKVIKIGAVWCNGCLVMRPRWQEIEAENPWIKTEYYDFDQDQEKIAAYQVEDAKLPVFIFLDNNNRELDRLSGEIDKAVIIDKINQYKDQ
jgi:thiol-disulfide isomerase/thioredoxin